MWDLVVAEFRRAAASVIAFYLDKDTGRPLGDYNTYVNEQLGKAICYHVGLIKGVTSCTESNGEFAVGTTDGDIHGILSVVHVNEGPKVRYSLSGPYGQRASGCVTCPVAA